LSEVDLSRFPVEVVERFAAITTDRLRLFSDSATPIRLFEFEAYSAG